MLSESALRFDQLNSIEEGCDKLAQFLNLDEPVTRDVFFSMIEDSTYAANIIMTRHSRTFLDYLLRSPPRRFVSGPDNSTAQPEVIERSNTQLLKKAAQSLLIWSGSGAQLVSDEVYQTRLSACAACPHYIEPPKKLLYKAAELLSKSMSNNMPNKVCNLCGCVTANKAKLATESCPDNHLHRPGYSRWNELQSNIHIDIDIDQAPDRDTSGAPAGLPLGASDDDVPDCPESLCLKYRAEINRSCKDNGWPPNRPILVYDAKTGNVCNCFCN